EAKLAAQLTHPNIVHIYDFGKVDNDYFIAMEYVDGVHAGQLFKLAERGNPKRERLPPTLVARLGADAAAALHYAHELRGPNGKPLALVHRDVSPANLMVSFDGVVKLCDFGIAKAAALSDQLTNPGQVKGKYAYMSPEQTVAAPLDGRSDVFSLAICLWELLAGKTIVGRGDTVEAMRAIRDGKLEPIESAAPDTPPALAKAIGWALETKREKRATAADFATALEGFMKTAPEIATAMQLASWLRTRVSRTDTGEQPSLGGDGERGGTHDGPGTAAGPGTVGGDGGTQGGTSQTASLLPSSIATPRRPVTPAPEEGPTARRRPSEAETPKPLVRPRRASEMDGNTLIAASRRPRAPSEEDDAETVAYDENGPLGLMRGRQAARAPEPDPADEIPNRPSWEATRLVSNRAPPSQPRPEPEDPIAVPPLAGARHSPRVIVDPRLRPPTPSVDPLPSLPPSLRQEMGLEQALGTASSESIETPLHPGVLETVEAELLEEEDSTGDRAISRVREDATLRRSHAPNNAPSNVQD
ncbi:MAG TPA: protein kinase, partial [Byssovorax sp.]